MAEQFFTDSLKELEENEQPDEEEEEEEDDGGRNKGGNGIWDLLNIPSPEEDEEDETFDELLVLFRDKDLKKMSKEEIKSLVQNIFSKRDLLVKALKCEEPSVFKELFEFFSKEEVLEEIIRIGLIQETPEHAPLITEILTHVGDEEEEEVTVEIAKQIVGIPGNLLGLILSYTNRGDNQQNDRWLKVVSTLLDRKFFHVAGYIMENGMVDNFFIKFLDIYSFDKLVLKLLDLKVSEAHTMTSFSPFGGDSFGLSNPFGSSRGGEGGSLKEVILLKIYDERSPIPINVRSIHEWLYNKGLIPKFLSTLREKSDNELVISNMFTILSEVSKQLYDSPNNRLYCELTSQNTFNQLFELMFSKLDTSIFDEGMRYVIGVVENYVREREAERESMTQTELNEEIYEKPIPMHVLHILHLNEVNFLSTLMDYLIEPPGKMFRASLVDMKMPSQVTLSHPFTEKRLLILKLLRAILLIRNRSVWKLFFLKKKKKKLMGKKKKKETEKSKDDEPEDEGEITEEKKSTNQQQQQQQQDKKEEEEEVDGEKKKEEEEEEEEEDDDDDDDDEIIDDEERRSKVKEGDMDIEYFERLVTIFFRYDSCSLMHNVFVEICFMILQSRDRKELQPYGRLIVECILKNSSFLPCLMDQEKIEKEKGFSGVMGHTVKIVNRLLERKVEIPEQHKERWDAFVNGFIKLKNEKYNFVLGKDNSYDDDDDDDIGKTDDDMMDIDLDDEDSLESDEDEDSDNSDSKE